MSWNTQEKIQREFSEIATKDLRGVCEGLAEAVEEDFGPDNIPSLYETMKWFSMLLERRFASHEANIRLPMMPSLFPVMYDYIFALPAFHLAFCTKHQIFAYFAGQTT